MEYIRQWKVGDRVFDNKADAVRYEAEARLDALIDMAQGAAAGVLIEHADEVVALLRPFTTKRSRKAVAEVKAAA